MSRRFTLFALLAAVCLLVAGCSALTLSSKTSSLIIPLSSSSRNAALTFGQSYCDHYEFTLYNNSVSFTQSGKDTIVFTDIPQGTYNLDGKAIGKLVDGKEHVIAKSHNSGIAISGTENISVNITFVLEEIAFTDETSGNNEYVVYEQDGADPNAVTKTVYADEGHTVKISEIENQVDGTKIIRNYSSASGNPLTEEVETQTNGTVITRNFTSSTEHPTTVTTQTSTTKTTETFDNSDWNHPAKREIIESTKTTTTVFATDRTKRSTETEVITSGTDQGKTTVTQFNSSDNPEKKTVKKDGHNTISLFAYTTNENSQPVSTETIYLQDWIPGGGENGSATEMNKDSYNVQQTIERITNSENEVISTTTTVFAYNDTSTSYYYDKDGEVTAPYSQTTATIVENGTVTTVVTDYSYGLVGKDEKERLKPSLIVETVKDKKGVITETNTTSFTYDTFGRILTVKLNGTPTEDWEYQAYKCVVYARKESFPTDTPLSYFTDYGTENIIFLVDKDNENALQVAAGTTDTNTLIEAGKKFLKDNFVLCGEDGTKDALYWAKTTTTGGNITTSGTNDRNRAKTLLSNSIENLYPVIYKVDQSLFQTAHKDCIRLAVDTENQIVYCIIHNDKGSCSNFWGSYTTYLVEDDDGNPINYGKDGTQQGAGSN